MVQIKEASILLNHRHAGAGGVQPVKTTVVTTRLPKIVVPTYDRTTLEPAIVHFGVGGFHRSHMAVYLDDLLEKGLCNWSIVGVGLKAPYDKKMQTALASHDYKYTVIERDDTHCELRVIGSISNYLYAPESSEAVLTQLANPCTRLVSLTITEGGYFTNSMGEFNQDHPEIVHDIDNPNTPVSVFGYIVEALNRRRALGIPPFTILSCDNLQSNGDVVRNAVLSFASLRTDAPELFDWIKAEGRFPNSMVDRITPQTSESDKLIVKEFGIGDEWPVVTEPFKQWVIEDKFVNDERPAFELVGVQFTGDILPYELMKLRLLNASHSSLAYMGLLSGYSLVHDVVNDPLFQRYMKSFMEHEVEHLLPPLHGVDIKDYQRSVIQRFANSTIQDQVARICSDGSSKFPKFILPSILEYSQRHVDGSFPIGLSLAVASWIRYLQGTDERGNAIHVADPLADTLKALSPRELLQHKGIFGSLSESEAFVDTISSLVERLCAHGSRNVLTDILESHYS